jgi:hypothetical protein
MFKENLVVAIKANNKVLREFKDATYIPFGSEYSILIKNLDTRRAMVRVSIDGTDATEGVSLIVNANSEIELERFIRNGNLKEGNKFKFIERTANIEKHRGSKVDDGFIRVEYQFEAVYNWNNINTWYTGSSIQPTLYGQPTWTTTSNHATLNNSVLRSAVNNVSMASSAATATTLTSNSTEAPTAAYSAQASVQNDVGITVPGAKSEQTFQTSYGFQVESTKHVITLKLLGESPEGKKVEAPVTVKAKPVCTTCGRTNQATAKFCSECGTALTLF